MCDCARCDGFVLRHDDRRRPLDVLAQDYLSDDPLEGMCGDCSEPHADGRLYCGYNDGDSCGFYLDRGEDGRWIAEAADLTGALAYGDSRAEALLRANALAWRVFEERRGRGESP